MPDYRIFIANCWARGEEFSTLPNGSRIRNLVRFRLGAFNLELVRLPDKYNFLPGQLVGAFHITSEIIVRGVTTAQRAKVDKLVNEVIELLSLATVSQVRRCGDAFGSEVSRQTVEQRITLYSRPTFGPQTGSYLKRFLEQTWPTYRKLRTRRMLHVVIDYVVTSEHPALPWEFGLLGTFVTLESLKSTYAKGVGLKFIAGAWRKISTPPKPNPRQEPSVGFKALLDEMFRAVGMRRSLSRIVSLRNHIVHNGVSPRSINSQLGSCLNARGLIREYLLRLLGYRGTYYRYKDMTEVSIR